MSSSASVRPASVRPFMSACCSAASFRFIEDDFFVVHPIPMLLRSGDSWRNKEGGNNMGTTSKSVFAQLSSPLQQYQTLRATSIPKMEVSRDNVKVSFFGASRTCCSPLICHTQTTSATGNATCQLGRILHFRTFINEKRGNRQDRNAA